MSESFLQNSDIILRGEAMFNCLGGRLSKEHSGENNTCRLPRGRKTTANNRQEAYACRLL